MVLCCNIVPTVDLVSKVLKPAHALIEILHIDSKPSEEDIKKMAEVLSFSPKKTQIRLMIDRTSLDLDDEECISNYVEMLTSIEGLRKLNLIFPFPGDIFEKAGKLSRNLVELVKNNSSPLKLHFTKNDDQFKKGSLFADGFTSAIETNSSLKKLSFDTVMLEWQEANGIKKILAVIDELMITQRISSFCCKYPQRMPQSLRESLAGRSLIPPKGNTIRKLTLEGASFYAFSRPATTALIKASVRLEKITLNRISLSRGEIAYLIEPLENHANLKRLEILDENLSIDDLIAVAALLRKGKKLETLFLGGDLDCEIRFNSDVYICETIRSERFAKLCDFPAVFVEELEQNNTLKKLVLGDVSFVNVEVIAAILVKNVGLTSLSFSVLGKTEFDAEKLLAKAIKDNQTLKYLDFGFDDGISREGFHEITSALVINPSLKAVKNFSIGRGAFEYFDEVLGLISLIEEHGSRLKLELSYVLLGSMMKLTEVMKREGDFNCCTETLQQLGIYGLIPTQELVELRKCGVLKERETPVCSCGASFSGVQSAERKTSTMELALSKKQELNFEQATDLTNVSSLN